DAADRLEAAHLPADRAVGDAEFVRRQAHLAQPGEGLEGAQGGQRELASLGHVTSAHKHRPDIATFPGPPKRHLDAGLVRSDHRDLSQFTSGASASNASSTCGARALPAIVAGSWMSRQAFRLLRRISSPRGWSGGYGAGTR